MILGLDLSLTSSGYCVTDDNKIKLIGTIKTDAKTFPGLLFKHRRNRNEYIWRSLSDAIKPVMPKIGMIVVEQVVFGARSSGASRLIESAWHIKNSIATTGLDCICEVEATVLKEFVTGNGKACKNLMRFKTSEYYDHAMKNDDEADAAGLAWVGSGLLGLCDMTPDQERIRDEIYERSSE